MLVKNFLMEINILIRDWTLCQDGVTLGDWNGDFWDVYSATKTHHQVLYVTTDII